jgi:hypothetical protein
MSPKRGVPGGTGERKKGVKTGKKGGWGNGVVGGVQIVMRKFFFHSCDTKGIFNVSE